MCTYPTWDEFFLCRHDNAVSCCNKQKSASASVDNFENMYRKKYGIWLDHHLMKLTKLYGAEKANDMIQRNIEMMYADEKYAAAQRQKEYSFHAVPPDLQIPF